jgi:hypothetical protein
MEKVNVKFSEWMDQGLALYKVNFGVLVVGTLLTFLIGAFTMGILAGPMYAGMALIVLRLVRGEKVEVGDVFKGFEYFLQTFLLFIVLSAVMFGVGLLLNAIFCVGQILNLAISLLITSFVILATMLIVDQKLDFWPACMKVFEVIKRNPGPVLGFMAIAGAISLVGAMACFVGVFFTWPLALCMLAVAYQHIFAPEAMTIDVQAEIVVEAAEPADESDLTDTGEETEKPVE